MKFSVKIGGVDYTDYVQVPFQTKNLLDESLDMASIRLYYTDKTEEFEPFTLVEIKVEDDTEKIFNLFVANDTTEEVISTGKFNHTLVLVEETKEMERLLLTKTTTNPLTKNISDIQAPAKYEYNNYVKPDAITFTDQYKTPMRLGVLTLKKLSDLYLMIGFHKNEKVSVLDANDIEILKTSANKEASIDIKNPGLYKVKYVWDEDVTGFFGYRTHMLIFQILFISDEVKAIDKTITMVVESLLNTCETMRIGDTPAITFNKEQAEQFKNTLCPEMSFPKQTLWEALRQIGGVIHAIPRLKDDVLYFDSYESLTYSDIKDKPCVSNTGVFDIEQFCSTIESSVDNLIATDNSSQGAIQDYGGLFKTIRTEENTYQITENNCYIETSLPIGRILKVEIGYLSDGTYVGDITPYIFEKSEYDALSSYDETYPTSKAFAIYYKLGQKNIAGLGFKVDDAVSPVFRAMAIKNIIQHKLGKSSSWIENLFSTFKIFDLQFRVTYQPYYSATLRQVKPSLKDLKFKSVLSYTQGANSISTRAYGEHLKGAVSRLGTPEKRKAYLLKNLSEIPNVGDKYDKDYRISEVNCEYYPDYILCEIGLAKKFNRWNNYVGVDNELRMYEVSNSQVSERPVIWEDYGVIQRKTENQLRHQIKSDLVQADKNILNGIWSGSDYVLGGAQGLVWFGDVSDWKSVEGRRDNAIFALGVDAKGNPLVLSIPDYWARYGNIFYSDDVSNIFVADNDWGKSRLITGLTFGNNKFIALARGAEYVGDSTDTKVLIGTPNSSDASKIDWIEDNTKFAGHNHDWKIAAVQYGGLQNLYIAVASGGADLFVNYHQYDNTNQDGSLIWSEKIYTDEFAMDTITDIKSAYIGGAHEVYAFNEKKLVVFTYVGNEEYDEPRMKSYTFPVDDIVDFGCMDSQYNKLVYFAISTSKLYYSFDLKTWEEVDTGIKDLQHIIVGEEEALITNGSDTVFVFNIKGNQSFISSEGIQEMAEGIRTGLGIYGEPVTIVNAQTYDIVDNMISSFWFPVVISSVGNTLQIQFEYVDNFSAGSSAQTNLKSLTDEFKTQTYEPYGDIYGEAKGLKVEFYYPIFEGGYENYEDYLLIGDELPKMSGITMPYRPPVISSSSDLLFGNRNHILLDKDSREKIKFSYCLHFVANEDGIIVGSGLAELNALNVKFYKNQNEGAKVYILNREISDFEKNVDISNAIIQEEEIVCEHDSEYGKIRLLQNKNETMVADGKAWAITMRNPYNTDENVLLFGKNVEFKAGDLAKDVWADYEIAFTHNVREFL